MSARSHHQIRRRAAELAREIVDESADLICEVALISDLLQRGADAVPIYLCYAGKSMKVAKVINVVNVKTADSLAKISDSIRGLSAAKRNVTKVKTNRKYLWVIKRIVKTRKLLRGRANVIANTLGYRMVLPHIFNGYFNTELLCDRL